MPVSKTSYKWKEIIAKEFRIPLEALWVTSFHAQRVFVYIWTEKLSKKDYERLSACKNGGGHASTRGKLSRFLQGMNADGWFTKVKTTEAKPTDLHPITPNVGEFRSFCTTCDRELLGADELCLQKCYSCAKVSKI